MTLSRRAPALARWTAHRRAVKFAGLTAGVIAVIAAIYALNSRASSREDATASGDSTVTAGAATAPRIGTIAVLPFVNTGGNAEDEYFSDGMTDELAHALSRLPAIRVAARTSTYAFKGKPASVQDIGRTLNVAGVVEGTVRRAGDRLRVTAQLTNAADGLVVWSDTYETRATDVFQVQDEFTKAIVSAIAPALGGGMAATAASESRGTDDLEAYDFYLKGRYFFAQRGARALNESVRQFRLAIGEDPGFARAHAGLALSLVVLPQYEAVNTDSIVTLAIASGSRALQLDSTIADAHVALGGAYSSRMQFARSEVHFRRAIALAPRNSTALLWYGTDLQLRGRIAEGFEQLQRASGIDPLSVVAGGNVALSHYLSRRYPEAIEQSRRMLQLDSTNWVASYWIMGLSQIFSGAPDSGLGAIETWSRRAPSAPSAHAELLFAYAANGRWADAERMRRRIENMGARAPSTGVLLSRLAFGDWPGAAIALERMVEKNEILVGTSSPGCEPIFDPLKSEPRYQALMRKLTVRVCPASGTWPIKLPPP